jgi:hypothetical protein
MGAALSFIETGTPGGTLSYTRREGSCLADLGRDHLFHQLCLDLARQAKVRVLGDRKDPAFFDERLPECLADAAGGVIYVFSDDNQANYRPPGGLPDGLVKARLAENWRTPSQVDEGNCHHG